MKRLQNLSYKTLLTIFIFSLAGIVFFLKIGGKTTKVSAAWWDDNWHYRQAINISSHTSTESNVYITTSINISSTDKAQTDDGDFRFISQSGENLSYYIISGAGTTNVSFHIQLNYFPAGAQTIFAYYGNSITTNGFSLSDFSTTASNYTIGSISIEESGGGPIAYWKFDEGSGSNFYNSVNNQYTGTFGTSTSAPTWVDESQCISGKCLSFDGISQYANTNQDFSWSASDSFSISFWIKPTSVTGNQGVIGKGQAGGYGAGNWEWSVRLTNSNLDFTYWDTNGSGSIGMSSSVTQNKWDFFTITYDPTNKARLYKNNILVASDSSVANNQNRNTPILLGHAYYTSGTNYFFNGYLDEVKFYPYARTAAQIKLDYNSRGSSSGSSANLGIQSSTAPSLKSSLIGYWKLDENNSSVAYDSSGGGHNGTLLNSPTWSQGKVNNALEFLNSGSQPVQPVQIPGTGTLENVTDSSYTFSAWIKPSNNNSIQYAVTRPGYHTGIYYNTNQTIGFILWNNVPTSYGISSTHTYPPNNWYHVIGIVDDTNKIVKIYINGKLDGSTSYSGTLRDYGTTNYLIGSAYASGTCSDSVRYCFNGLVDEVKIYNRALTADEIKQDYNANSAIQFGSTNQTIGGTTTSLDYCIPGDNSYCAAPVAEYNFEENTGTTVKDISGNSYNGTFGTGNSSPSWTIGSKNKGSGAMFDGNDYINFGDTTSNNQLSNLSAATYSFWIYPQTLISPTGSDQRLLEKRDSTISSSIATDGSITALFWYYTNPTYTSDSWSSTKKLGFYDNGINQWTAANLNKWYYITFVFDSNNNIGRTYINGILDREYTLINCNGRSTGTVNQTLATQFGRYRWNENNFFRGRLDNLKIYNYARTPAQIAYDYNKGAPVGWWKLDECQGSITNDSSGVGNTGVIFIGSSGTQNSIGTCQIGTSAAWTNGSSGHSNGSLNFDGIDDYVDMGTTIGNNYSNISVSAWIYPTSGNTGTIIAKNGPFYLGWTSQKARGSIYNGTSWVSTTGNTTLSLNQWHHLLMTYNGTNINVYVDGKYDGTNTTSGSLAVTSAHVQIGGNTAAGFNQYFSGQIDDVRIYNYTLTQEQVKQIYNGGSVNFQ